ncbi:hypothetical protein DVH24_016136 [Malus domestica]|uniref:Transmembrane protein n=1 Tax=Malus domestica TaxID=3750 RepID=A0A498JDZ4_MALDO|nr:hypothetical protein DVH24_016136 [Malus domestica]
MCRSRIKGWFSNDVVRNLEFWPRKEMLNIPITLLFCSCLNCVCLDRTINGSVVSFFDCSLPFVPVFLSLSLSLSLSCIFLFFRALCFVLFSVWLGRNFFN